MGWGWQFVHAFVYFVCSPLCLSGRREGREGESFWCWILWELTTDTGSPGPLNSIDTKKKPTGVEVEA